MPKDQELARHEYEPEPDTLVIEDQSLRLGFIQLPKQLLYARNLSRDAKLLYAILLGYAWQDRRCFPGYQRLCLDMQASENMVRKYMRELEAVGLLRQKRRGQGKTNIYVLADLRTAKIAVLDHHKIAVLEPKKTEGEVESEEIESSNQHHHPQTPSSPPATTTSSAASDDVLEFLKQHGISPREAHKLATQYPAEVIREKVELLQYLQQIKSPLVAKNPPGWLRMAVIEDYLPPPHYLQAKTSQERRRQVEAEQARTVAEELRRRAQDLAVPPNERAQRWLITWDKARRSLGMPPRSEAERAERLQRLIERFTAEGDEFFQEHPELRPAESPGVATYEMFPGPASPG